MFTFTTKAQVAHTFTVDTVSFAYATGLICN